MAGKRPKYLKIRDQILQQISDGLLQPGDRLPVRSELIKQLGVTRTTLDKALNALIANGTLVSAKRGGTVVAEPPPPRRRIAVVARLSQASLARHGGMPSDVQRMFASMILGATGRADILFLDEDQVLQALEQLADYDGVIWVQPDQEGIAVLQDLQVPVFISNRYTDRLNYASTNHRAAITAVTDCFIDKLGTDIDMVFVASPHDSFITQERRAGFVDACREHGLDYQEILAGDAQQPLQEQLRRPLNPERTTLIISMSAVHEPAILELTRNADLHRGENFYYADCDNDSIAQGHRPAALTITQNYPQMGQVLMEAAIAGVACQRFIPWTLKGDAVFLPVTT